MSIYNIVERSAICLKSSYKALQRRQLEPKEDKQCGTVDGKVRMTLRERTQQVTIGTKMKKKGY